MIYRRFCFSAMGMWVAALCATLCVMMGGCKDDFTGESPSILTESDAMGSADMCEQALMGIYSKLTSGNMYGKKLFCYMGMNSDCECISGATDNGRRAIARYVSTEYNTDLRDVYKTLYQCIREANNLINGIERGMGSYDAEEREMAEAVRSEAVCIRGLLWLEVVRNFGDAVYMRENGDPEADYQTTTSRKVILGKEIEAMEEAVKKMPKEWNTGTNERINRDNAKALIARMCMTRAGHAMESDRDGKELPSDWRKYTKKALKLLREIIDEGKYGLEEDYEGIFRKLMRYETDCEEVMLVIPMTRGASGELGYYSSSKHEDGGKYGSAEAGMLMPPTYYYEFDHYDKRRAVTFCLHKYTKNSAQNLSGIMNITAGKFRREWLEPKYEGKQKYTGVDVPLIRYADVLLMAAECETRLEERATSSAKEWVKMVRERAFDAEMRGEKVDGEIDAVGSAEDMMRIIERERKLEFGGEMQRKWDLMRWGKLGGALEECKSALGRLKARKGEFNDIPEKIYWRVGKDGETMVCATTDNTDNLKDFDFESEGLKNTKWAANMNEDFIKRMCEAEGELRYFQPKAANNK